MSLFKRKTRATRRAEARAMKAKAKLEAKLAAKNEIRRIKAEQQAETKALRAQLKAQRDSDKAALKVAETQLKAARESKLFSPTRIRRTLTVTRLLAPVVVPLFYRAIVTRRLTEKRSHDQLIDEVRHPPQHLFDALFLVQTWSDYCNLERLIHVG